MYLPNVPDTVGPRRARHARHARHRRSYRSCPNPSHVTSGSMFLKTVTSRRGRNNLGRFFDVEKLLDLFYPTILKSRLNFISLIIFYVA